MSAVDFERLRELRQSPDWPSRLDALAERAAAIGRLVEADDRAREQSFADSQSSSQSSGTIAPARVPFSYSELPNWQATYYARLERALLEEPL